MDIKLKNNEGRKMKKNKNIISRIFVYLLFASTFIVLPTVLFGQIPKSEKEIPIYPGAKSNATKTSEQKSDMGWDMDKSLRKGILQIYDVDASPEDVFYFYLQKIGGKEGSSDIDPMELEPGTVSQVWYEVEYYEDQELTDYYIEKDVMHPGKWMKQKLIENRKPHKPGKWITEAKFNWYYKERNNDLTEFYLIIHDESFDLSEGNKYKTNTEIQIQVTTRKSEIAMQEEAEEEMDKRAEELSHSLKSKPPTEKDLGAPIYPGAQFNADASAGMSLDNDYKMYIYLTTDPPSKVVNFYELKLKKKAEEMKGHFLIPLKGKMPVPEEGISIEPNTMFGGNAKTVITIQKMMGGND